jgi:anthranilate 1,2-dioxygenase large subunit
MVDDATFSCYPYLLKLPRKDVMDFPDRNATGLGSTSQGHDMNSGVPYEWFSSQKIYDLEQKRIFMGPTWNFLGLAAEIAEVGDYKSTFIGATPVVMTRSKPDEVVAWVNRCAHRGAAICRQNKGNAQFHSCVYHQWTYDMEGNLIGVPFMDGHNGMAGMPDLFRKEDHGIQKLRTENYHGLIFATFDDQIGDVASYIGPELDAYARRILCKPLVYLGCTRQYSRSNWKLYFENVKDPYHASLLHLFHTTFNIFRVDMRPTCFADKESGLHSLVFVAPVDGSDSSADYKRQKIRSYDEGFVLEDDSLLSMFPEHKDMATNHIQTIFPSLVIQQIHNTLAARQLIATGPSTFELVFHFFGYEDDSDELRALRFKQGNLVGPAGYISMEDTAATELVQWATTPEPSAQSTISMGLGVGEQDNSIISEGLLRQFWSGYRKLMGLAQ